MPRRRAHIADMYCDMTHPPMELSFVSRRHNPIKDLWTKEPTGEDDVSGYGK